jgi:hypothetical protein
MNKENKLIVADESWAESIPEWVLEEVENERKSYPKIIPRDYDYSQEVGNAELVCYLMTASLRVPLNSEHTKIYLYLTRELMIKCNKLDKNNIPDFLKDVELNDDEKRSLKKLQEDIFKIRGNLK